MSGRPRETLSHHLEERPVFRVPSTPARKKPARKRSHPRRLNLEELEPRNLLSATSPADLVAQTFHTVNHLFSPGQSPPGLWPSQVRHAYGFDKLSLDGTGQTIAIVDAYSDSHIASDLTAFDNQFGIAAPPSLRQVSQTGGSSSTVRSDPTGGWEVETALDVEWAHAIAPKANLLLVDASSASLSNLLAAVSYAASQPGVVAVSMSWGSNEFSGQQNLDSYFTTPAGHQGVTFVAASGDNGTPAGWPASSPNVLAVGGTSLALDGSDNRTSEPAWSSSGGGYSAVYNTPSYQQTYAQSSYVQNTLNNQVLLAGSRGIPDVSYAADPSPGFAVYDSFPYFGTSYQWFSVGGTSAGAPQWAALIALADQQRGAAGSLDGPSQVLPQLYTLAASSTSYPRDFYDVTTGSNGFSAQAGYDLATGLGSPQANNLVPDLAGNTTASSSLIVSAASTSTAGSSFGVTVTAHNPDGTVNTNYTGTVHFTTTDGQAVAGLPADYTFTTGTGSSFDNGSHTFTVTLYTAGNQTVTATDTGNSTIINSTTVAVSPATATKLVFGQQPTTTLVGATITPAVTVQALDAYGNLVTTDNTDTVSLAIGTNPAGGTLSGTTTATLSGGVATFSNLSINQAGTGYTLVASSATLADPTSASFNIVNTTTIEGFESGNLGLYNVVGGSLTGSVTTSAAHDGSFGLRQSNGNDWIYRNDAASQVSEGNTISVWVNLASAADGRAYFGFDSSSVGTLSVVLAPNTGEFLIQSNFGYGFTNIGAAAAPAGGYQANTWYRLEVAWGTDGSITGRLFGSDGTTLLDTVTATTPAGAPTSGGIAFRAIGHDKFFDTVTQTPGATAAVGGRMEGPVLGTGNGADDQAIAVVSQAIATVASSSRGTSTQQAQATTTSALQLTETGIVLARATTGLTSLPGASVSVATPTTAVAPVTPVLTAPAPVSRVEIGGGGTAVLPDGDGAPERPGPARPADGPEDKEPAPATPAVPSGEAQPAMLASPEAQPVADGDEQGAGFPEFGPELLPVLANDSVVGLQVAAAWALAIALGGEWAARQSRSRSRLA
jgi:hypothetical protein